MNIPKGSRRGLESLLSAQGTSAESAMRSARATHADALVSREIVFVDNVP